MPQMVLPMFSPGVKEITSLVGYENRGGNIYYFVGQVPLFSHGQDDVESFRYITSQLHVSGHVTQSEIVKAFGVTSISVKRSVKLLRKEGMSGFVGKTAIRMSPVMGGKKLLQIQSMLNEGDGVPDIAKGLELKAGTINKAIREGKLHRPCKKKRLTRIPKRAQKALEASKTNRQPLGKPAAGKVSV